MARQDHVGWLHEQLARWREEGVVDAATAARIAARHPLEAGSPGIPLLYLLGGGLVGIGLIWLVAANLEVDEIGPLQRGLGVAALWLALVAAGEALHAREERWRPLAAAARLLAALAYGATVFQAAQSLQVPAYDPGLVFAWGAGALAYAYATRARGPLTVGMCALGGWYVWALAGTGGDGIALIVGLALACPAAAALAALQEAAFGDSWRFAAAASGLLALGVAAVPEAVQDGFPTTLPVIAGAVVAIGLGAAAARRAPAEVGAAAGVAGACLLLVAIAPEETVSFGSTGEVSGGQTGYTLLACALFLAFAAGVAVTGATRGQGSLTNLAFGALLLFVAVQSFGLLATIASGAVVVLVTGAILLAAGLALDRGRRRLLEEAR